MKACAARTEFLAADPVDSDLDDVRELGHSKGYALVVSRVHVMIERLLARLEQDLGPQETFSIRGQIKAYREMLTIPESLTREIGASDG